MSHLSSPKSIMAMIFYSLLTFFIVPSITRPFFKDCCEDPCLIGFLIGFTISIILWVKFRKYLYK